MTVISINHDQQRAFDRSWWKLLDSGEKIIALCDARCWLQAQQLLATRDALSQQHFQRFPIGPTTRHFYHERIADLFEMEALLNELQSQHTGQLSNRQRPSLALD